MLAIIWRNLCSTHWIRDVIIVVGIYVMTDDVGVLLLANFVIHAVFNVALDERVRSFGVVEEQISSAHNLKLLERVLAR